MFSDNSGEGAIYGIFYVPDEGACTRWSRTRLLFTYSAQWENRNATGIWTAQRVIGFRQKKKETLTFHHTIVLLSVCHIWQLITSLG